MTKLTIIFQVKLTKTNPAPPMLHTFNIEGIGATALKSDYKKGVAAMQAKYPNHRFFERIAVFEDRSSLLQVAGIADGPTYETE